MDRARKGFLQTPEGTEAFMSALMGLIIRGYKPYEISRELSVPVSVVVKHTETLVSMWREQANIDATVHFGRELDRLNTVVQEAFKGWEASRRPRKKTRLKAGRIGGEHGAAMHILEQVDVIEGSTDEEDLLPGDPRFLEVIYRCSQQICKLTGVEKAVTMLASMTQINILEANDVYNDRLAKFRALFREDEEGTPGDSLGHDPPQSLGPGVHDANGETG